MLLSARARVGRKSVLALGAAALALATGGPAVAQDAPAAAEEEVITVTGSRIARPDYQFSNPVVSVGAEQIENSGITNVTEFLQDIPALLNSDDNNDNAGSNAEIGTAGLNLLNLRNLGTDRTLVLVNGRRHVGGLAGSASVDTNSIPTDLIQRVEVLTGGASAVYGADGVSGVVNFVLREDFEGFKVRTQFSNTEEGGGEQEFASLIAGSNFDNDRGNITVAVEYSHEGRIGAFDRDYSGFGEVRFINPEPSVVSDFDRLPFGGLGWYDSGTGGAIFTQFDFFGADFDGNTGGAWDPGIYPDSLSNALYSGGGSATPVGGYSGDLAADIERFNINLLGHYDITNNIRFFTELKFVKTQTFTVSQPSFDFFLALEPDYYYLQDYPQILADAAGNGADLFGLTDGSVLITRDNFDFGRRADKIDRETLRGVWGLDGEVGDWGRWNVSYTFGQLSTDTLSLNNRYNDRYAAALDAVDDGSGNPICRSDLDPNAIGANTFWNGWDEPTSFTPGPGSGCVPINIIGNGAPSQAALDWILTDSLAKSKVTQQVVSAYWSGSTEPFFSLPAGAIGYSIGAEWRREESEDIPAIEDQLGLTFSNAIDPTFGSFEVREVFAELNVPILSEAPFADTLSIDLAGRYSDYSTVGDTSTWKFGGVWAPIRDLRFRGTIARAVRAPNIGELFNANGQTFQFIDDPCDVSNVNDGTSFRQANCAQLLSALGADPNTFTDPNFASIAGFLRGNPDLIEETADTQTIGFIYQPSWLPRFTFSVDYYDIEIADAINTLDPETIAQQCVDLPTIDNQFCDLIIRDTDSLSDTFGGIIDYSIEPVNVASFRTQGYDFTINYILDPADLGFTGDWGTFGIRLVGNYLEEATFVNLPGAEADPDIGEVDVPEWQAALDVLWERGPWAVNYGYSYFSETERYATSSASIPRLTTLPEFQKLDARSVHDIQVRFSPSETWDFYAGVNNFTNQEPDYGQVSYPVGPEGRTFYVGLSAEFGAYRPN